MKCFLKSVGLPSLLPQDTAKGISMCITCILHAGYIWESIVNHAASLVVRSLGFPLGPLQATVNHIIIQATTCERGLEGCGKVAKRC
jgi:hypothetical protein